MAVADGLRGRNKPRAQGLALEIGTTAVPPSSPSQHDAVTSSPHEEAGNHRHQPGEKRHGTDPTSRTHRRRRDRRRAAVAGRAGPRRGTGRRQAGAELLPLQGRRHPGHRGLRRQERVQARGFLRHQCEEGRSQRGARKGLHAARHDDDLFRAAGHQYRRQAGRDRHRQRRSRQGQQQGRQRPVRR